MKPDTVKQIRNSCYNDSWFETLQIYGIKQNKMIVYADLFKEESRY